MIDKIRPSERWINLWDREVVRTGSSHRPFIVEMGREMDRLYDLAVAAVTNSLPPMYITLPAPAVPTERGEACPECGGTGDEHCLNCNGGGVNGAGGDCMECSPPKPCKVCKGTGDAPPSGPKEGGK